MLTPIKWYPENLVWQLNAFKRDLKRKKGYEKLHKFMQRATDAGLISRQELVSMIPPLLLDIQSTDIVFDMCAAPGNSYYYHIFRFLRLKNCSITGNNV